MGNFSTSMYPIRAPEPVAPLDPVTMMTRAAELQSAMARTKLIPAEIERTQAEADATKLKTQTAQEDAADQQTLQKIYGDVQNDASIPPEKKLEELRSRAIGQVKPRAIENLSTLIQAHQDALTKASDAHVKAYKDFNAEAGNTAQGILNAAPERRPALSTWTSRLKSGRRQAVGDARNRSSSENPEPAGPTSQARRRRRHPPTSPRR